MSNAPAIPPRNALTPKQYREFSTLVYELTRINLGSEKQELAAARINKRLRALSLPNVAAYLELLRSPLGEEEKPHLIDVISTHHTFFYREHTHFDFVRATIVPELQKQGGTRRWRFWSAACSTGEESATLAMTLAEAGADPHRWEIASTDISAGTVKTAARMIFKQAALQKLPAGWAGRYFHAGKAEWQGHCRLVPALRRSMTFGVLNLAEDYSWEAPFDTIFLRNVMIYFDRPTQLEVLKLALRHLRPGGYLISGQSESLAGLPLPLKTRCSSIYQYQP
ncbi:MAG: CheR family methyltransferase [Opitutales bacterium]